MNTGRNENDTRFIAEKIRTQYMEKVPTELDALRALDARVKRPVTVFSYIFGGVSAVVMGAGMSLIMTDIGAGLGAGVAMTLGVTVGAVGLALALLTYPLHKKLLSARKKKYSGEIMSLSDEILGE